MKRLFVIISFIFLNTQMVNAQFDYGVTGGFSISSKIDIENTQDNIRGLYGGVYGEINFLVLYVRPEINITRLYTKINSIEYSEINFELPVSIGYKILPLLSVYAGPLFKINVDQSLSELSLSELENTDNIGIHIGTRFDIGPVGVNLTYNGGSTENQLILNKSNIESGRINKSKSQLNIGLSFSFN